jgi:hypothetical protein
VSRYLAPSEPPLGRLEGTQRRCFSPTSATDLRHVHPWTVGFPSVAAFTVTDLPRALLRFDVSVGPQRPSRRLRCICLSASAAPSRCALDGAHRASAPSLTAARSFLKGAEHRSGRCSLSPGFVGRRLGWQRTPLTLPVALREYPDTRTSSRRTRTAFPIVASTTTASTAQSAFHRQVLSLNETRFRDSPFLFGMRARHRSLCFAAEVRLPAFFRCPDALALDS